MLDASMTALAATAANALVQAMVTDGWNRIRDRAARLFGENDALRRRETIEQLTATRDAIRSGQVEPAAAAGSWQGRLESLLEARPGVVDGLSELIDLANQTESPSRIVSQTVATGSRSKVNQAGRDINSSTSTVSTKRTNFGGLVAVLAVLAAVAIMAIWGATKAVHWISENAAGITEATSCRDYLKAPTEVRENAVKTIGLEKGVSDAGHPFARLNVDYVCGQVPDRTLGEVIKE